MPQDATFVGVKKLSAEKIIIINSTLIHVA
jgi:hypothetical protein